MLRALAKTCVATAYSWSQADRLVRRSERAKLPFIAGYHRVVQNFQRSVHHTIPSMLVSTATFERHLDSLARRFDFASLDDIGVCLTSHRRFSRPAAAITFDDGYADVFHNAFPILKRKGIPAAVFVVTEVVGTNRMQVHDRLYRCLARPRAPGFNPSELRRMTDWLTRATQTQILKEIDRLEVGQPATQEELAEFAPLSWEMIAEMEKAGMTIGSHTASHALLTSEEPAGVSRQIIDSKTALEARLKHPVHHFAYPDGRWNGTVLAQVHHAGYRFAYTICPARHSSFPLLTIPRKVLWEESCNNAFGTFSPSILYCHGNGVFDAGRTCEHVH